MAQGISANKQQSLNIHLLLTVPPVETELPELLLTINSGCGVKRPKK